MSCRGDSEGMRTAVLRRWKLFEGKCTHTFYLSGQIPSVHKLLKSIEVDNEKSPETPALFKGSTESLRKVLTKHLGFKFKKVDRRKHLLERTDVVAMRHEYLRHLKEIDLNKNSVIFLDETWVNENHSVSSCWQSESVFGVKAPSGKGKRLIVLHAGTINGFVPNCLLLFVSKSGLADYHEDMNAEVFTAWFESQLLPNIPPNSTIIMDNASYHSVQLDKAPNSNSLKRDMQNWLTTQNIPYSEQMLKAELYELVKRYKPQRKKYVIDEKAVENGHRVIRLPPYHCEFNPIELIWAQVKGEVAKKNTTFKMAALKELTETAVNSVTQENWKKAVKHVEGVMNHYRTNDPVIETTLEPIIISLNNESDSDTDSDEEESSQSDDSFEESFRSLE